MQVVKIYHPILDISVEQVATNDKSVHKIKKEWKKRYGKLFDKCTISVTDDGVVRKNFTNAPPVIYIPTGEEFENFFEAAEALGVSKTMVYTHCCKRLSPDFNKYVFRFKNSND